MSGPRVIYGERDFRLVKGGTDQSPIYTLEVEDGCDALGQERWREFHASSQHLRAMLGYLIRMAVKLDKESLREP